VRIAAEERETWRMKRRAKGSRLDAMDEDVSKLKYFS